MVFFTSSIQEQAFSISFRSLAVQDVALGSLDSRKMYCLMTEGLYPGLLGW